MAYEVILKPSAEKTLDALPRPMRKRVADRLEGLRQQPRPAGAVKLAGKENLWRIRVGGYRVVYEIKDDRLLVLVLRIAQRRNVYHGL
jgi:mRNA interferase RelE/StbE